MMKQPIGHHVTCSLVDGRVIAPTPAQRRVLSRVVLEKSAGHRLLAFNCADTHLHKALAESAQVSMQVARRIEASLHYRLGLPVAFVKAYPEPILKQQHLINCFNYILRQQPHHNLAWDPYLEASNLPDLLGLRLIGAHTIRHVRTLLPRVDRRQLLSYLGLSTLEPADGPLEQVVPAALAAAALSNLKGRDPETAAVRRAVLEIVGEGVPLTELATRMEVDRRTLQRARPVAADATLVKAIRLQLGLRLLKADRSMGPYE